MVLFFFVFKTGAVEGKPSHLHRSLGQRVKFFSIRQIPSLHSEINMTSETSMWAIVEGR